MFSSLLRRRLFLLQVLLLLCMFLLHLPRLLLMFVLHLLLPCIIGVLLSQSLMLPILRPLHFLMFLILHVRQLLPLLLIFLIRLRIPGAGRLSWLVRRKFAGVDGAARRTWHIVFWTPCFKSAASRSVGIAPVIKRPAPGVVSAVVVNCVPVTVS